MATALSLHLSPKPLQISLFLNQKTETPTTVMSDRMSSSNAPTQPFWCSSSRSIVDLLEITNVCVAQTLRCGIRPDLMDLCRSSGSAVGIPGAAEQCRAWTILHCMHRASRLDTMATWHRAYKNRHAT